MKRFARDINCCFFVFSIISVNLEFLKIYQRLHVIWTVSMAVRLYLFIIIDIVLFIIVVSLFLME
jgi:hypothetical protein